MDLSGSHERGGMDAFLNCSAVIGSAAAGFRCHVSSYCRFSYSVNGANSSL